MGMARHAPTQLLVLSLLLCSIESLALPPGPFVWPVPAELRIARGDAASASVLSADLDLSIERGCANEVTTSAISRYTQILRNATHAHQTAATVVTKVEIAVDNVTDSATLSLDTQYNYTLSLAQGAATIQLRAGSRFGVAHGLETLAQLYGSHSSAAAERQQLHELEPEERVALDDDVGFSGFSVTDRPSYPYRALMIDCGRRFVPLPTLYELLDGMAYAKMSVLNLHASEYGFFRIAIKAFPELTHSLGTDAFYSQSDIKALVQYAYLRGIRVVPQIDVPGHSSGLHPLEPRGLMFCPKPAPNWLVSAQLYDDPAGRSLDIVTQIYDELLALFPDAVFDIGGDETQVVGNCTLQNLQAFESKLMAHLVSKGKRPLGWEQIFKVTGAAQQHPSSIVRVYDTGTDADRQHNGAAPLLLNVTEVGQDVVVGDSARYYLNSCCPAVHGKRLCVLGELSNATNVLEQEPCYFTDIARFDMGNHTLTPKQRTHLLGGSASMWTDAYCATAECGAWTGSVPEAGWMATASPAHDAAFHDSVLASIFPAAAVSAGAFYHHVPMPLAELNARWHVFNDVVLNARGVRTCPSHCTCAEDNYCGKLYAPADYEGSAHGRS